MPVPQVHFHDMPPKVPLPYLQPTSHPFTAERDFVVIEANQPLPVPRIVSFWHAEPTYDNRVVSFATHHLLRHKIASKVLRFSCRFVIIAFFLRNGTILHLFPSMYMI